MRNLNNIKHTGKLTALISFAIGTFLLIFFLLFKNHQSIIMIGIYYVIGAFVINTVVFITLLLSAFYFWNQRVDLLKTCGILLLNIPIAIGYFYLVLHFIDL